MSFYRIDIRASVIVLFVYNHSDIIIELNELECWIDTTNIGIESKFRKYYILAF